MTLITAIEQGLLGPVEETIETFHSKVFLIGDRGYKVYKPSLENYEFTIGTDARRAFYEHDFAWNQAVGPEVYLALHGMREDKGEWKNVPPGEAEDFYIEMTRLPEGSVLSDLLETGAVTEREIYEMGARAARVSNELTAAKRAEYKESFAAGWPALMELRFNDLAPLVPTVDRLLTERSASELLDRFRNHAQSEAYIREFPSEELIVGFDLHADNVHRLNGTLVFTDAMLPRERWRVIEPLNFICSVAVDCQVFSGEARLRDAAYEGYATVRLLGPESVCRFYETYYAFIKAYFLTETGQHERAEKFVDFISKNI